MLLKAILLTTAIAVLSAGCGGASSSHFTLAATKRCLGNGLDLSTKSSDLDYIAQDAAGGAFLAKFIKLESKVTTKGNTYRQTLTRKTLNSVTVSFERTDDDAKRTAQAYSVIGDTAGILSREGNAVLAWDKTPTTREARTITDCLEAPS